MMCSSVRPDTNSGSGSDNDGKISRPTHRWSRRAFAEITLLIRYRLGKHQRSARYRSFILTPMEEDGGRGSSEVDSAELAPSSSIVLMAVVDIHIFKASGLISARAAFEMSSSACFGVPRLPRGRIAGLDVFLCPPVLYRPELL